MYLIPVEEHIKRSMFRLVHKVKVLLYCHWHEVVIGRNNKFLHIAVHQMQPLSFHFQFAEIE